MTGVLGEGSGRFQMWEMLRFQVLPGILLAVLVVASPANGAVVQALELPELVAHADRIVLGRVLFSESFRSPSGQLGTWHRIAVERELRGSVPDEQEVIVETLGGQIGDIAMRIEGEGVMRVHTERGVETVRQNREGMMLMRRNAQGRLEGSLGARPEKQRLDALLSKLRVIVEQSAGGIDE